MPELPEVEVIKRGLSQLLPAQVVRGVVTAWDKSFPNSKDQVDKFLINSKITKVRRLGKVVVIDTDTSYSLIIHLKMTGQLVDQDMNTQDRFGAGHPNQSLVGELPDKSTRVIIELSGARLFFNDQRRFGWVKLVPTSEIPYIKFFKELGPEPLSSAFNEQVFAGRVLRHRRAMIKAVLLNQRVIAGVGNIYADESLWGAKIHPASRVEDLSKAKLKKLCQELISVFKLSIEKGGSTDKNYIDAMGNKGSYLEFARVFRREGLPCPRCGTTIVKIRVAGRGTHICPKCQKL